jgi:hypothetical protein
MLCRERAHVRLEKIIMTSGDSCEGIVSLILFDELCHVETQHEYPLCEIVRVILVRTGGKR